MTSPLVERLTSSIKSSASKESRAFLISELACYWARTGEFEVAERLRVELRTEFGDGRSLRVSVMVMCLEALMLYYKELSPNARDRMARATLLSNAARERDLIAITSAWMAHIDFNLNRFESMSVALSDCFNVLAEGDFAANCRASIVLGDAFLFSDNLPIAKIWYERARQAAVQYGDQAAVGAMVYNRAALRVAAARFASLTRPVPVAEASMIRAEVKSAINYQIVARIRSLDHLLRSAEIGALILQENFHEAGVAIDALLASNELQPETGQAVMTAADQALVWANAGRVIEAANRVSHLLAGDLMHIGPDDRGLILWSLLRAAELCNQIDEARRIRELMDSAITEHERFLDELRIRISPYAEARYP
jgi:hypothetical protein